MASRYGSPPRSGVAVEARKTVMAFKSGGLTFVGGIPLLTRTAAWGQERRECSPRTPPSAAFVRWLRSIEDGDGLWYARRTTEGRGLMISVEDASDVSSIGKGYNGEWLYHLPFTSEEHAPAFIEVFYLSLGHIARVLNLPVIAMWHLARVVSDVLLFLVTFGFIATFIPAPIQRRAAYLLAIFGGGFDWAWLPWEHPDPIASAVPLDLRMPEAHLFFSALTFPHFAAAISFILITFSLALRALDHATISW